MESSQKLHLYDALIASTFLNIGDLTKGKDICLQNFDYMNPEHKYLLRIAMYYRDLSGNQIYIISSRKEIRKINRLIKKGFSKILRAKKDGNINVPELIAYLRQDGIKLIDPNFRFSDILNEYYDDFMKGKK